MVYKTNANPLVVNGKPDESTCVFSCPFCRESCIFHYGGQPLWVLKALRDGFEEEHANCKALPKQHIRLVDPDKVLTVRVA